MATNITFLSRRKQRIDTEKNWKTYKIGDDYALPYSSNQTIQ